MSKFQSIRRLRPRKRFSPSGFLAVAAVISLAYGIMHLLGWREHTGFLSGNIPPESAAICGMFYAGTYFGFVIVVPILVIAAGIFATLLKFEARPTRSE